MSAPAEHVVERLAAAWRKSEDAKREAIGWAIANHSSMPDNYWRDEYLARQKLVMAIAVADALSESGL